MDQNQTAPKGLKTKAKTYTAIALRSFINFTGGYFSSCSLLGLCMLGS